MVLRITGLDLSLTSAGVARLTVADGAEPCTYTCALGASGEADASLAQRWWRLDAQRTRVLGEIGDPHLVVVEGPSYASEHGQQHDRSGLWWLILDDLHARDIAVAEVAPSTLKMWATGSGATSGPSKVSKARVIREIRRDYGHLFDVPSVAHGGSDIADAVALATLGAAHLGEPLVDVPTTHLRALRKVRWPAITQEEQSA